MYDVGNSNVYSDSSYMRNNIRAIMYVCIYIESLWVFDRKIIIT